ncbi:amidohydrolase family protein [Streptomyces sp. NPDC094034]|uniref:amidohydrolase family protein n=1 Tax=Streptomyces sp. NPDC094034 TaxID=3155309 RepID=UPI00331DF055
MTPNRILITGGTVLVGPPRTGTFRRTCLLIENDTIVAIGDDLPSDDAQVVDAEGTFVLPGFVDAHAHLWEATMRGISSDWNLIDFAWSIRYHHSAVHAPADLYAGVYAGAQATLDGGTTTVLDHAHATLSPQHADAMLQGVKDSGLRAIWAYGLTDVPTQTPVFSSPKQRHDDLRRIRAAHTDGLVSIGVAVNDLLTVPWQVTVEEYALAHELNMPLTAHLNTAPGPQRVPEAVLLHHDGLLGTGQVYSHGNASSDDELALLAAAGAALASTPESEAQMGIGYPALARARAASVTVGLGSDLQANNSPDAFTQMRLARQLENARANQPLLDKAGLAGLAGQDKLSVTAREAFCLATQGGAEALGLAHLIGSLEPGKAADVVLVRNTSPRQRPIIDPFATVVEHSSVGDVDRVIVAGRTVKSDGRLLEDRADRAVELVESAWAGLSARMAERGGFNPPRPDGLLEAVATSMAANLPERFTA